MSIELSSGISVFSMITFSIFCFSFFFNVGVLIEINGSAFLEKFDDKKKLIKNAKEELFDFKTDALKKLICLFPYFISIVFCYSLSPFLIKFIKKHFQNYLPTKYQVGFFVFLLLYYVFLIGEAFWGQNEKYIERKGNRIYYNRPLFRIIIIMALFYGSCKLDSAISIKEKKSIMTFMHIYNIETFQLMFTFSVVELLNDLFVAKCISRYVVLVDNNIYISHLIEKNDYYSFYGMANLLLSLLMILTSIFLTVKYAIWNETDFFALAWPLLLMLPLSVLAGQRDYFVTMTRRKYIENNKLYYKDVNGNNRFLENLK